MRGEIEEKLGIPEDFGGLVGAWIGDRGVIARCGHGEIIEAMLLTPLNALQLVKIAPAIVAQGREQGKITAEHHRQSDALPMIPPSEYHPDYAPRD
jgi:hypothetical protein